MTVYTICEERKPRMWIVQLSWTLPKAMIELSVSLKDMMLKLGLADEWVPIITRCVEWFSG
jgi:hypothetical protein